MFCLNIAKKLHYLPIHQTLTLQVGQGELSCDTILQFVTVFAKFMASLKDSRLISQITRYVFLHLIRQTELGIEHQMKFSAWKEVSFMHLVLIRSNVRLSL